MEIYEPFDKESKIIILKNLNELQENTDRLLSKIRKQCLNRVRNSTKRKKPWSVTKKKKILVTKNTIIEVKKTQDSFYGRLDQAEEIISELKDRSFEIAQSEEQKE